jgi:hypothetical protein
MSLVVRKESPQKRELPCPIRHQRMGRDLLPLSELISLDLHYPASALTDEKGNAGLKRMVERLGPAGQLMLCQLEHSPQARRFFETVQGIINSVRGRFIEAKLELETVANSELLRTRKQEVLSVYLKSSGVENGKRIDAALAQASGDWNSETEATLDAYWPLIKQDPWPEIHGLFVSEIFDSLHQTGIKIFDQFAMTVSPNPNYGSQLKAYSFEEFHKWIETLKTMHKKALDKRAQKKLAYLIFKAELFYPTMIRGKLRVVLMPFIQNTPDAIQALVEKKQKKNKEQIENLQKELNSSRCCIDPEQVKKMWPDATDLLVEQLKMNRELREKVSKDLQALSSEDCFKWAQQLGGFNFEELQKTLNDNSFTLFDRKIIELLSYLIPDEEEKDPLEEALVLNLSPADAVAYFTKKLRERDRIAYTRLCSHLLLSYLS